MRICSSVLVSTLASASSRMRMRGSRRMARAMAVRCFWPPESVMPRSPTMVWNCAGNSRISVAMCAVAAAASMSRSECWPAAWSPKAMLSAMVVEKRKVSCGTKPMARAQGGERVVAQGAAVEQDFAGGCVVQARDERDQRGLAGAGGADDGERRAGGDVEGDVVQDRRGRWDRRR